MGSIFQEEVLKTTSGGGAGAVRCVGSLCKDGNEGHGKGKKNAVGLGEG